MNVRSRAVATVAALGAALSLTGPPLSAGAIAARPSSAAPSSSAAVHVPTITVRMSGSAIRFSSGHRVHAGRVIFRVKTKEGAHSLQLLRLHRGYTMHEASRDFPKAFQGNLRAIRRLDDNISWLGGASTKPERPGKFSVKLRAGRVIALDQQGGAVSTLRVVGTASPRPRIRASSGVTAFSYGFGTSKPALPHRGWTRVRNRSDQPHFIVFQRVKDTTTNRMVRRAIKSGGNGNPPWVLKVSISTGVISPNRTEVFHHGLPAGKYLMACFWPDDDTGMPHFFMGMWKLVRLR